MNLPPLPTFNYRRDIFGPRLQNIAVGVSILILDDLSGAPLTDFASCRKQRR
jgi:hypothetical protein